MAAKRRKPQRASTPLRMQRHTQRAHRFKDRRKEASRKACRRPVTSG
jgi:hypothetical protein